MLKNTAIVEKQGLIQSFQKTIDNLEDDRKLIESFIAIFLQFILCPKKVFY